ncbi:MAG: CobW family GTP-binding protein [Oliverpabstia sp.]
MKNKITRVDLFTGFLGAGKTTLIQKYGACLSEKGIRFAVIENEYGKAGVDTAILQQKGMKTKELAGGCICCTLKAGFHDLILKLHEEGAERILVEPSGIYEVSQFFSVMNSEHMKGKCEIGTVFCVVDPLQINIYDKENTSFLKNQLLLADGIILSRTQLFDAAVVKNAVHKLNEIAPLTPVLFTGDWETLTYDTFEKFSSVGRKSIKAEVNDMDHSTIFQSCTLIIDKVFTSEGLKNILSEVMSGEYGDIMRIKGFFHSKEGTLSVNTVPGQISIEKTNEQISPMLNVIGLSLNRRKIKDLFLSY